MSKKPKKHASSPEPKPQKAQRTFFSGRDGLGAYTVDPKAFPPDRVIYYNDDFTFINDLYPKSTVHCLVLPRDEVMNVQHPFDAFEDPAFLAKVQEEVKKARTIVADELRRRYGRFSAADAPRLAAMESDDIPATLPPGRDWSKDVVTGIHAHPSMAHLHVHVMSRDMVGPCMRHRKHYESFNTPFLVDVDQFPLARDDPRRHPGRSGFLDQDLKCWRCGRDFGHKFAKLQAHLEEEFEDWKRQ